MRRTFDNKSAIIENNFVFLCTNKQIKTEATVIKMYVMHTCPDCEFVEKNVVGNPNFEVIDIGKHVRNL